MLDSHGFNGMSSLESIRNHWDPLIRLNALIFHLPIGRRNTRCDERRKKIYPPPWNSRAH